MIAEVVSSPDLAMSSNGSHPGATWRRADFQCHSPRDLDWLGETSLPGVTANDIQARKEWAERFVSACLGRNVSVVAITDHHDIAMVPYIRAAAQTLDPKFVVFPGMEITCSDDAQCLAIFDPSSNEELWNKLLGKLPNVMPSDSKDAKTCTTAHAGVTVVELFQAVEGDLHLRDNCLILPHFSDGKAHKHLNAARHHPRFAELECDGVYIEKPFGDLEPLTISKAYGKISEWGQRRRAILPTGDNRSDTWARVGLHECWVKLGERSIEALRQALLADEARVSHSTPSVPHERIVELRVKSELCGADPISLTFNEGFTAFIGGRGSGKSSLLEYLRYGLARTANDLPAQEAPSMAGRESNLVQETLGDGDVEIVLDREGVRETWRRDLASRDVIQVTDAAGQKTTLTLDDARRRFRARGFYQKGLSSTMNDPVTAADQITGIAAAEALERRREADEAISGAKRAVTTALQQVAAYWQNRLQARQASERVADLKARILSVNTLLGQQGVSAVDLAILAEAPKYSRGHNYLAALSNDSNATALKILDAYDNVVPTQIESFPDVATLPAIQTVQTRLDVSRDKIRKLLWEAATEVSDLQSFIQQTASDFSQQVTDFQAKLNDARAHQTAHKALIDDGTRLGVELQAAEAKEAQARASEHASQGAMQGLTDARNTLDRLLEERRTVLQDAASSVASNSSGTLKARVQRDSCPPEYMGALGRVLEGSHVVDAETKCRDWVTTILKPDAEGWRSIADTILAAYEAKVATGSPPEPGEELSTKLTGLFFGGKRLTALQTKKIYTSLSDESVGAVVSAVARDFIVMTYVDEKGRNVRFENASPGQQASALLELLLRQAAGTLIIDQPEDDLDNRVVMRIVELIRTSKNTRQLIFATHNPNIVVNGDADKVISLRSGTPSIKPGDDSPAVALDEDGAIETPAVREAITRIMEGGRQAFALRSRKYRFGEKKLGWNE